MKNQSLHPSHTFPASPVRDRKISAGRTAFLFLCGLALAFARAEAAPGEATKATPDAKTAASAPQAGESGGIPLAFEWKKGHNGPLSETGALDKPGWSKNAVKWTVHVSENGAGWPSIVMSIPSQDWSAYSTLSLRFGWEQPGDSGKKIVFFYTNNGVRVDNPPAGVATFVLGEQGTAQTIDLTLGDYGRDKVTLVSFGIDCSTLSPGDHVFYLDDLKVKGSASSTPSTRQ